MDRTLVGGVVIAAGVMLVLLAALADPIGIGVGESGFGWEEALGVIVGAVAIVAGLTLVVVERGETRTPLPH